MQQLLLLLLLLLLLAAAATGMVWHVPRGARSQRAAIPGAAPCP